MNSRFCTVSLVHAPLSTWILKQSAGRETTSLACRSCRGMARSSGVSGPGDWSRGHHLLSAHNRDLTIPNLQNLLTLFYSYASLSLSSRRGTFCFIGEKNSPGEKRRLSKQTRYPVLYQLPPTPGSEKELLRTGVGTTKAGIKRRPRKT